MKQIKKYFFSLPLSEARFFTSLLHCRKIGVTNIPYIKRYARFKYLEALRLIKMHLDTLSNENKAGELNFLITSIVKAATGSYM